MTASEWAFEEWEARVRAGKPSPVAVQEVKALIEEQGRVQEVWQERGTGMLHQFFAERLRQHRRAAQLADTVPVAVAPWAEPAAIQQSIDPQPQFGERRYDVAILTRSESIFDSLLPVGKRAMRHGDMQAVHWELKSTEYATSADNATARHWACSRIIKRLEGDRTTEETFGEEEFKRLIPEIGF